MNDDYGYGDERPSDKDSRVMLMERLVDMESAHRTALIAAKEATSKASKIATEIANIKNELHKLLGVVSEDEARAIRVAADR